jgi:hypothetical protein
MKAITHRRRRPRLHALNANGPCGPRRDTSCVELDEACMAAEHAGTAASVGDHGKESRAGQLEDDTTQYHSFSGTRAGGRQFGVPICDSSLISVPRQLRSR